MTTKERAYLRSLSNNINSIFQVGKFGVTPELCASIDEALEKRELIKITVLTNCDCAANEVAEMLQGRTKSKVVQVIGKKIVLFRASKKQIIKLPK